MDKLGGLPRRCDPRRLRNGIVKQMRRCMHIAVAFLAVLLLVRPFDCFAGGKFDQKAADCCKKGKCSPSNSDDCCKATVPGGNQLVTSKAPGHSSPVLDLWAADAPSTTSEPLVLAFGVVVVHPPPGSPPDFRLNLPLLI
jgi:hypothetical protein